MLGLVERVAATHTRWRSDHICTIHDNLYSNRTSLFCVRVSQDYVMMLTTFWKARTNKSPTVLSCSGWPHTEAAFCLRFLVKLACINSEPAHWGASTNLVTNEACAWHLDPREHVASSVCVCPSTIHQPYIRYGNANYNSHQQLLWLLWRIHWQIPTKL